MNIQGHEAEIFLSEIRKLVHKQFKNLGNITGDFFLSLEVLYTAPYYNDQLILQLKELVDNYAAKGDEKFWKKKLTYNIDSYFIPFEFLCFFQC